MKRKAILIPALAALMCACGGSDKGTTQNLQQQVDSLTLINEQKDSEIDEMLKAMNAIEDGFRQIDEAQGRVTIERTGEGATAANRIREDMEFIRQTMVDNSQKIAQLQQRINNMSIRSEQLAKTVENLTTQLREKTSELESLRQELESKNIHIARLDEQLVDLNRDNNSLRDENAKKDDTIDQQSTELNTAWYVFGTKSELKDHNILKDGKVLQQSFDANYFTRIDIREVTNIPLYAKHAEILTTHPAASYTLERDASKKYTLYINDADLFWSTSKYLVIQVK